MIRGKVKETSHQHLQVDYTEEAGVGLNIIILTSKLERVSVGSRLFGGPVKQSL